MIHIKYKNCGWRLPFSSKGNEDIDLFSVYIEVHGLSTINP